MSQPFYCCRWGACHAQSPLGGAPRIRISCDAEVTHGKARGVRPTAPHHDALFPRHDFGGRQYAAILPFGWLEGYSLCHR